VWCQQELVLAAVQEVLAGLVLEVAQEHQTRLGTMAAM